jgi:hypothetical protein
MPTALARMLALIALAAGLVPGVARAYDVVLNSQGEWLDAYLFYYGTLDPPRLAFIDPDPPQPDNPAGPPARVGRHVNGPLCFMPRRFARGAAFVIADDTYREACLDRNPPQARCNGGRGRNYVGQDADGWGVFRRNGRWTKRVIAVPWTSPGAEDPGNTDPQGCLFLPDGTFIGVDVGHGDPGTADGSLVAFFPGRRKSYDTYCFLARASLAQPSMPLLLDDGSFLLAESGFDFGGVNPGRVTRYSGPFPTSEADCPNADHVVTTPPTKTTFTSFPASAMATPAAIARVPGSDHVYITSPLVPPIINEYSAAGVFVRTIAPTPMNPLGIGVGSDGTAYFAELHLSPTFQTGCGSVSRVRFDNGQPLPQETLSQNLLFPDGVTVIDSGQLSVRWESLPPSPENDPSACSPE